MSKTEKSFFWYELMTSDLGAAEAFYTKVVGWKAEPFDKSPGMPRYSVMMTGGRGVGGLMVMPDHYREAGGHPAWVGYIHAADTDEATESVRQAGGKVHREPSDIPGVGRFSVVADPQGAAFMLLAPTGPEQAAVPMTTPGHVGWHELYTNDWETALDFYSSQFGWAKGEPFDMGEMGTYQLFNVRGEPSGGMMNKPPQMPTPVWQFYFNVDAIDAAAKRVTTSGGKVLMGPMQVPGGSWIIQCQDQQGAHFALVAPTR